MFRQALGDRLVMSPLEPLAAGGAEAFDRVVRQRLDRLFARKWAVVSVDMRGRHSKRERV